jgi:phage terminase large subunit GpA-like protein
MTLDLPTLSHPEERALWSIAATVVRPRVRERFSTWVERNIRLPNEITGRPGPIDLNYKPWSRDVVDVLYNEPHKKGIVGIKRSQVGFTLSMILIMTCLAATDPGPTLFVTDTADNAKAMNVEIVGGIIGKSPALQPVFTGLLQGTDSVDQRNFIGGNISFCGAGTESGVISWPYRFAFIDEFQASCEAFPTASGDLLTTVLGRFLTYKDTSLLCVWSHPRFPNQDVDAAYQRLSDQRAWVFDCPHCNTMVIPCWDRVSFEGLDKDAGPESAALDPARAVFRCNHCAKTISDAQRSRALWPRHMGGTGRFESKLPADLAAKRDYIGLEINGLADPDVTVIELAKQYLDSTTTLALQSFFNKTMGEVYQPKAGIVTHEIVESRIRTATDKIILPDGKLGVYYLTAGVDVQAPEDNPMLVTTVSAWTGTGFQFVVAMEMIKGWAALMSFLRSFDVAVGDQSTQRRRMGISICSIDVAAWTRRCLDQCRLTVYSAANNAPVQLLPVRFQTYVKSTAPAVLWREEDRRDPARPELGLIEAYNLHRNTWVDRAMRRFTQGTIDILCRLDAERKRSVLAHVAANRLVPVKDVHGWGTDEQEWKKEDKARDDWLMSLGYSEVGAAVKLGLDRLHEIAHLPDEVAAGSTKRERDDGRAGFLDRGRLPGTSPPGRNWFNPI